MNKVPHPLQDFILTLAIYLPAATKAATVAAKPWDIPTARVGCLVRVVACGRVAETIVSHLTLLAPAPHCMSDLFRNSHLRVACLSPGLVLLCT